MNIYRKKKASTIKESPVHYVLFTVYSNFHCFQKYENNIIVNIFGTDFESCKTL